MAAHYNRDCLSSVRRVYTFGSTGVGDVPDRAEGYCVLFYSPDLESYLAWEVAIGA